MKYARFTAFSSSLVLVLGLLACSAASSPPDEDYERHERPFGARDATAAASLDLDGGRIIACAEGRRCPLDGRCVAFIGVGLEHAICVDVDPCELLRCDGEAGCAVTASSPAYARCAD